MDVVNVVIWQFLGSIVFVEIFMNVVFGFYLFIVELGSFNLFCMFEVICWVQVLFLFDLVDVIVGNIVICLGVIIIYSVILVGDNVVLEWIVNNGGIFIICMGEMINVIWGVVLFYELSVVQVNMVGLFCVLFLVSLFVEVFNNLEVSGDLNVCFDGISIFMVIDVEYFDYEWIIIFVIVGIIVFELDESMVDIFWYEVGNVQV